MTDPEKIIVQKNQTIRRIRIAMWSLLTAASALCLFPLLPVHLYILYALFRVPQAPLPLFICYVMATAITGVLALVKKTKALRTITAVLLGLPILSCGIVLIAMGTGLIPFPG